MNKDTSKVTFPITSPSFNARELDMVAKVLDSKWVTQGPITRQFEISMEQRHRIKYALATTSCTAALHLATLALNLGVGDEVIVPAFTWVTSAHCVEYVGAKVVFVDVDPTTFNIDPTLIEAAITKRTKAIIAVHLFGLAAPMDEIMAIANKYKLAVIEDAACAIGTTYKGIPVGGIGTIGCFSFHPRKIITTGEGGIVSTNDPILAENIKALRNHGGTGMPASDPEGKHPYTMGLFNMLGFNLRLSDIQAGIGIAQFEKLEHLLSERQRRAQRYHKFLGGNSKLKIPSADHLGGHTYQSYVLTISESDNLFRNNVMDKLASLGIQTRPGTHAVHRLGYYAKKYNISPEQFPNASKCEDLTITLPIFPNMTDEQQDFIVDSLLSSLEKK